MAEPLRNVDLEAAIQRAPEDPVPYQIYADWLTERGDPRGELIALQVALEKPGASPELQGRAAELVEKHRTAWLGDLPAGGFSCTWRRGFLDAVTLGDDQSAEIDHAELYATLRALPAAIALRGLTFGAFSDDVGQPSWEGGTKALLEHGVPPTLRRLAYDRGSFWDISWTQLGALEPVYALVPRLEELYLEIGHMDLGRIDLPSLRSFEVRTGGFTRANMRSVLEARWPSLERLVLCFGDQEDYGAECDLDDVLPLLEGRGLDRVVDLGICNAGFANDVVPRLVGSPMLRKLRRLDLSLGTLSDEGAEALLEHAAAFRHLENLDVSGAYVSEEMVERLRATFGTALHAEDQRAGEEDEDEDDDGNPILYRYCQIGE